MNGRRILLTLVGLAALAVVPHVVGSYPVYLLNSIAVYGIVALGLNLLVGWSGQLSIGHGAFLALGAYASALTVQRLGLPFLAGLAAAGAVSALAGFIVGLPAVRLKGHYLGIATLGFALIVQQVLYEWESVTGGRSGMTVPKPAIAGYVFSTDARGYYLYVAFVLIFVWLTVGLLRSRTGRAFDALRDSEISAAAMGINVARYKVLAFVISGFYTGVAGGLYAHFIGYISADSFGMMVSVSFLSMTVIGGLRSVPGSILGAGFLVMLPELLRSAKDAQMTAFGIAIVLAMLILPKGLVQIPVLVVSLLKDRSKGGVTVGSSGS